ncbi:helix-turn-helix domain-containing protein [Gordonia alkaliphila]|uniref:helix-turn-helix domain-containing protein n=1 Tax=Gordonia alkaliphila TaxID=1053547 RepID=UPI001FF19575|nr:helix-turn-helix domain-containing protein [Gordonia alkaliphila]MCK0439489.1 helix-turn-helix domain-containing protein [Gordonia alkaliphila]
MAVKTRSVLVEGREQEYAQRLLAEVGEDLSSLAVSDGEQRMIAVPKELVAVIVSVVEAVADGAKISVERLPEELTTTVAADQLGVSRPAVMKMIQRGELASHKVGTHHRVRLEDVLELKRIRRERRRKAFADLRALDEELESF